MELFEGSWVGMLEATFFLKSLRTRRIEDETRGDKNNRWAVSCVIESNRESDERPVSYYKWEKEDLRTIVNDKRFGRTIINALYAIWLPHTIYHINRTATQIGGLPTPTENSSDEEEFKSKSRDFQSEIADETKSADIRMDGVNDTEDNLYESPQSFKKANPLPGRVFKPETDFDNSVF